MHSEYSNSIFGAINRHTVSNFFEPIRATAALYVLRCLVRVLRQVYPKGKRKDCMGESKRGGAGGNGSWPPIINVEVAKALGNVFRQEICWLLNERVASPTDVAKEFGESLNKVCHHMKVLEEAKCIELAYERTIGNRIQHFYQATPRAFLEDKSWPSVPPNVQVGMRGELLQTISHDAVEAVVNETYDAVPAHMSWTPLMTDGKGQIEAYEILLRALREILDLRAPARQRLAASGEPGIPYSIAMLAFQSAVWGPGNFDSGAAGLQP